MKHIALIHDIIKGYKKEDKMPFLVRVSSLPREQLGNVIVEALTIFDKELKHVEIKLSDITHNFGDWDMDKFAKKYPEYLI